MKKYTFLKQKLGRVSETGRKLVVLAAFLVLYGFTAAQDQDYRNTFADAEYYFLFQDYREALPLYLKLYEVNPENINLHYRLGLCYFNIPGLKHHSIPYLEKAITKINPAYQEGSYKEIGAPDIAYFYLGEAYRVNGQLIDAINAYKSFRDVLHIENVYYLEYVDQQIKACELATEMMRTPLNVSFTPLQLVDENKYIMNPVVSYDGNSMVFTIQEKFYDAVYWVTKDGDNWGTPINITLDLVVEGELYATALNSNGTQLYLHKNDKGIGNIYTSSLSSGKWEPVKKLGKHVCTRNWETHASVSSDGKTLYFASMRKGGYGGLDIYKSTLLSSGEWGPAENLGPTINTPQNEEAPFVLKDGDVLFFSSQGHNNIGGYDIFYSQKIDDNRWSVPVNMGYPVNTTDDELFYYPLDKNTGLMAIVEKDNPNSRKINTVTINPNPKVLEVPINGKLILADNCELEGNQFLVKLLNLETGELVEETHPENVTGIYKFSSQPGAYRVIVEGSGYTPNEATIVIPEDFNQSSYSLNQTLTPDKVTSGEFLVIKSILFDFNSSDLNREATFEVEKVYNLLVKYPSLNIEVSGHTDNKGSAAYNQKLSLKRAESIIEYLKKKGIDQNRLTARAANAFENVAANVNLDGSDNPEGRSLNRRACVTVLNSELNVKIEEDINIPEHLKPHEQNYTILLAPINVDVTTKALSSLKSHAMVETRKLTGNNKQFAHIVGSYNHKSQAIDLLNYCIDNSFPRATIVGETDIMNQLSILRTVDKKESKKDAIAYTVQVYANKVKVEDFSMFKGINVKEVKGKDGFYRYIYGEFSTKSAATKELGKVKELGFDDAFIMNMNRYAE